MIFEANIVSSVSIPEDVFLRELKEFGAELAKESDGTQCAEFHRDHFSVIARMLDPDFDCFKEAGIDQVVKEKLGGEMHTLMTLEFGEGADAFELVVAIAKRLGDRWPIVLDNGRGLILDRSELGRLISCR